MPYELSLPAGTPHGWVAKIYDKELPEEPHVTIRFKFKAWRVSLRTGKVLDRDPPARELDAAVLAQVRVQLGELAAEWDRIHPSMPVSTAPEKVPKRARKAPVTKTKGQEDGKARVKAKK